MVWVNAYMVVATLKEQLLLCITFVEPGPRAPDTIMNYSSEFITEEVFFFGSSRMNFILRLKKG